MSINGLQSACNQKTSRSPIVQYDEVTIADTLNSLKKKSLKYPLLQEDLAD